jgi:hypothetical protein
MLIVAGLLIAALAVYLVIEPVLRGGAPAPARPVALFSDSDDEDDPVQRRRDRALAALKEIEFDRATGKLSDDDYERLRGRYTAEALEALRAAEEAGRGDWGQGTAGPGTAAPTWSTSPLAPRSPGPRSPVSGPRADDPVESLIAAARAESRGKRFCAECGSQLEGSGRFCVECGTRVAA